MSVNKRIGVFVLFSGHGNLIDKTTTVLLTDENPNKRNYRLQQQLKFFSENLPKNENVYTFAIFDCCRNEPITIPIPPTNKGNLSGISAN